MQAFSRGFARMRVKAFTLPFVKLAMFVPRVRRHPDWWYGLDARLLARFPFLASYASIRVIELTK